MSAKKFQMVGAGRDGGRLTAIMSTLSKGTCTFNETSPLDAIMGGESFVTGADRDFQARMSATNKAGVANSVSLATSNDFNKKATSLSDYMRLSGMEAFSHQMDAGSAVRQKAATIELNSRSDRQWPDADAMYKTVIVGYNEEQILLPVDVAGVGAYNLGGNSNEAFEDLRPIASVLRDSKFNPGDDLRLVPVLPTKTDDPNYDKFVSSTAFAPWTHNYGSQDLLGRGSHLTNYLAMKKINNLMSLCQAPGAPKFDQTDEIEPNSINLDSILFELTTKDATAATYVTLNTATMANTAAGPSTGVSSDEKRQINFVIDGINVKNLKDKDGVPTKAFDSLLQAGLEVFVQFELTATYHRSTRTWSPTTSNLTIAYVTKAGVKMVPGTPSMPQDITDLVNAQVLVGEVHGILPYLNHNNVNRSRYGTTVVFASDVKKYNVHRKTPISIKYPMNDKDDSNADILAMLVKQMDLMVTRNMSHDAFKTARAHFKFLHDNNGAAIVRINDTSSHVMPSQHFLQLTAVQSKINLIDEVSTLDSKDTRDNIEAALVNKVYDIITALRVNSNIAMLKTIDSREEKYVIVAHSSLAPFLMTTGDYRTFGENIKFKVIETNIDSEIGTMWVFPESQTTDSNIDIFGGLGICVTKELLVIEGEVMQADKQFKMVISQPSYRHHSLGSVCGQLVVEDMDKLLGDEGLIGAINKHLVKVSGELAQAGAGVTGKEVEVEIGGNTQG